MKRKFLKILTFALAVTMCVGAPLSVYAADITIESVIGTEDATYTAFRILNLETDGNNFAYSVNEKYRTALQQVTGKQTDEEKMGIKYSQIAEMIETGNTDEKAKVEILRRYNASKHKRTLVPVYKFDRKNHLLDY